MKSKQVNPYQIVLMVVMLFVLLVGCDQAVESTETALSPPTAEPTPEPELAEARHVVVLYSYEPDFFATTQEDSGIVSGLASTGYIEGENLEITRLYMNTKTVNTTPELMTAVAAEMAAEIESLAPDALLLHDDDALRNVGPLFYDSDIPVVFGGVNGFPSDEAYTEIGALVDSFDEPGHNITGVLERPSVLAGFKLLHQVVPDAETALFMSDKSPVTSLLLGGEEGIAKLDDVDIQVVDQIYTDSFEELKTTILENQDKVDVIVFMLPWSIFDEDGNHVPQDEVVGWMMRNNKLPGIAFLDILAEEGYLTGVVVDMNQQGFQAARMIGEIMQGANPATMPVIDPVANRIMFNMARADQLGIEIPFELLSTADTVYTEMTTYPEYEYQQE